MSPAYQICPRLTHMCKHEDSQPVSKLREHNVWSDRKEGFWSEDNLRMMGKLFILIVMMIS